MAANLVRAGYDVTGYDVVPAGVEKLLQAGGKPAPTIAEAVAGAEVVITMLPDSPQVAEVVLGPGGVLEAATAGLLLIDMSSIAPETSIEVARTGTALGVRVLDGRSAVVSKVPSRLRCPSWSAARPRTSKPRGRSSRTSAGRSCTSVRTAPARR